MHCMLGFITLHLCVCLLTNISQKISNRLTSFLVEAFPLTQGENDYILKTRGPRTLALCLTAAVGMTVAIFCRLISKHHCCRQNQLKYGLTLTQYLTKHVSILDHIRHLNFDPERSKSRSLKFRKLLSRNGAELGHYY